MPGRRGKNDYVPGVYARPVSRSDPEPAEILETAEMAGTSRAKLWATAAAARALLAKVEYGRLYGDDFEVLKEDLELALARLPLGFRARLFGQDYTREWHRRKAAREKASR